MGKCATCGSSRYHTHYGTFPLSNGEECRRASGDQICTLCGKDFYHHPKGGPLSYDGGQFLYRLCDGSLVHL